MIETKSLEYIFYVHPILTESIDSDFLFNLEHPRSDMHGVLGTKSNKIDRGIRTKNPQNA